MRPTAAPNSPSSAHNRAAGFGQGKDQFVTSWREDYASEARLVPTSTKEVLP